MSDVFTKAKRSQVMSCIRSSGNRATEREMIRIFRANGITGWRRGQSLQVQKSNVPVGAHPDFVFRAKRTAVFVDGEFWHGHPTRCRDPKTRRAWWLAKIEGNRRRDKLQNRALRAAGWTVVRVWQFELKTPAAMSKLKRAGLA
jgi:DNA mismatch endonuclease (patch repair protein)